MLWLKTVIIGTFACEHPVIDKVFRALNSDLRFHESSFIFTAFYFFTFHWLNFHFVYLWPCFFFFFTMALDWRRSLHESARFQSTRHETAHHLNNGSCLETARIRIWGLEMSSVVLTGGATPSACLDCLGGGVFVKRQTGGFSSEKKHTFSPQTEFQPVSMFLTTETIFIVHIYKFLPRLRDQGNHRARRAS